MALTHRLDANHSGGFGELKRSMFCRGLGGSHGQAGRVRGIDLYWGNVRNSRVGAKRYLGLSESVISADGNDPSAAQQAAREERTSA